MKQSLFFIKMRFALLLAILFSFASAYAYDFEVNGIYYNKNGSVEATVVSGNGYSGDIVIPETVTYAGDTYAVTAIGNDAFNGQANLNSVTIPGSVKTIGSYAFYCCTALTSLNIGEGVTTINDSAFEGCTALTEVTIPNSVTSMAEGYYYDRYDEYWARRGVFAWCSSLTTVKIGNGLTRVPHMCFYKCPALVNLTIGDAVTVIGSRAFWQCSGLVDVNIPNSVTTFEDRVFADCIARGHVSGQDAQRARRPDDRKIQDRLPHADRGQAQRRRAP